MGAAGHGVFVDADSWPKDPGDEVIRPAWVSGSRDDHGIGVEPSNGGDVSDQPAHRLLAGKDSHQEAVCAPSRPLHRRAERLHKSEWRIDRNGS